LGAALLATWWGIAHAISQWATTFYRNGVTFVAHEPKIRRRCTLLALGMLFPSIASIVIYKCVLNTGSKQVVLALYWNGLNQFQNRQFIRAMGSIILVSSGGFGLTACIVQYLVLSHANLSRSNFFDEGFFSGFFGAFVPAPL
jgi:uncharacterized membrane protein YobD (UPF0266 family)